MQTIDPRDQLCLRTALLSFLTANIGRRTNKAATFNCVARQRSFATIFMRLFHRPASVHCTLHSVWIQFHKNAARLGCAPRVCRILTLHRRNTRNHWWEIRRPALLIFSTTPTPHGLLRLNCCFPSIVEKWIFSLRCVAWNLLYEIGDY